MWHSFDRSNDTEFSFITKMDGFSVWEETKEPRENLHMHGNNMQKGGRQTWGKPEDGI